MICEPRKEKTSTFQKNLATFQILTATGPRGLTAMAKGRHTGMLGKVSRKDI